MSEFPAHAQVSTMHPSAKELHDFFDSTLRINQLSKEQRNTIFYKNSLNIMGDINPFDTSESFKPHSTKHFS